MQGGMNNSLAPAPLDIARNLPLQLVKSEIIPPALNRTGYGCEPAIDWLYDFAGYSWIAYGASSLLVISHFPNPLAESETLIGPILRQVFELSVDGTGTVSAVSWSPVRPSVGEVAAAVGNCIGLFSYNWEITCNSSFCWSQSAMLVQPTMVEAIKWTFSGNGIVTGGIEVVLWRRKDKFWERAWKFKPEVPHVLVSASWSIEGSLATAPHGKLQVGDSTSHENEASKCTLVTCGSGDSRFVQAELRHPSPISMIQWRPSTGRPNKDANSPLRSVLLTGSLDGTVRLWCESDDGRVRKSAKDSNESKIARLSFRVVAVIEVNQALHGTLGSDVFVRWAAETDAVISIGSDCFSSNDHQHDKAGSCEWLIGFGPHLTVSLWAIHCLDDFSPLRFPRVMLWKKQNLTAPEVGNGGLLLDNVFIARNKVFNPPKICSFVELLPCNSLAWLHLYSFSSPEIEERSANKSHSENTLSSHALGILDISSHSGNLLQVVVHPYLFEVSLAASLDMNRVLRFWHLSPASGSIPGLPTLNPSCKLSGRTVFPESHPWYTSLGWTPAIINDNRILVMGHAGGIDCFMIKVLENEEEKFTCHHLCTVPFGGEEFGEGPSNLCSVPLPSACSKTFISDNFLLLAVWKKNFRALSWKMTIHQSDLPFNSSCNIGDRAENNILVFESDFCGNKYRIYVDHFSSIFPATDNEGQVSSFSVVCPTNFILSEQQEQMCANVFCSSHLAYHLITGYHDGTVKLWRSVSEKSSNSEWVLVGILAAHQGPIVAISPSACCRKVATASPDSSSTSTTVCIWECVHIGSSGNFILEDTINLGGEVISLNWFTVEDGLSLLGVCLHNELKIYARRRCGGQAVLKSKECLEGNFWVCMAVTHTYPVIHDFFWGPRAMLGLVHLDYFCLFSHLSLLTNKNSLVEPGHENDNSPFICDSHAGGDPVHASNSDICNSKQSSLEQNGRKCQSQLDMISDSGDNLLPTFDVKRCEEKYNSGSNYGLRSLLEVAGELGGSIYAFLPEALLLNISAGNWKRAYVALQHLVKHFASAKTSEKSYCFERHSHVVPQIPLSNYLEGMLSKSLVDGTFQWSGGVDAVLSSSQFQNGASEFASGSEYTAYSSAFTSASIRYGATDFLQAIGKLYDSGGITNSEKLRLHAIVDILQEVSNSHSPAAYGSLDEPGRRFWVAVKFQQRYFVLRFGRSPLVGELVVFSGLTGWAFHSDCQENLFNSLLSNETSWEEMRDMGVGFWYTNTSQLRLKMEKLARQQYLKNKDPKACALLYIALNRLQVLAGLFKMSKDEKDKPLVGFLSRNFQEDKNKAAALKNAYVLMGKHQLELAIAFFLLGGDTSSAVSVCAKNLGDEQLALVICRLVEGYGGPLERNLISKFILPSAISRGDYWLASIFEWTLGNYHKSFLRILGAQRNLIIKSAESTCQIPLWDPSIGQYCLMLATKTSLKNAIGEQHASVFGQWAVWMSTIALNRSGLPLEALECLSSSMNILGSSSRGSNDGDIELQNEVLKLFSNGNSSNWISDDVASCIDYNAKVDFAMQYISVLLKEHPAWRHINMESFGVSVNLESANQEYKNLIEDFLGKLAAAVLYFEQKFSLIPSHLINKILLFFCHNGLAFIGYHTLCDYVSKFLCRENSTDFGGFILHPILLKLILMASEEASHVFSRYITICSISCSKWKSCSSTSRTPSRSGVHWLGCWKVYLQSLMWSLWCLGATLKMSFVMSAEDLLSIPLMVLDLTIYYACFASAYIQMNFKGLAMIVRPLLIGFTQGNAPSEIMNDLKKILFDIRKVVGHDLFCDHSEDFNGGYILLQHEQHDLLTSIPADDRWQVVGLSLWGQVSCCLQHLLSSLPEKIEQSSSLPSQGKLPNASTFSGFRADINNEYLLLLLQPLSKLLKATCSHISVYCGRQFASYLVQKGDARIKTIIFSSEDGQSESSPLHKYLGRTIESINILKSENGLSPSEILWLICADPKVIRGLLPKENPKWFEHIKKFLGRWDDMYISILRECEVGESSNEEDRLESPRNTSPRACLSPSDHPFISSGGRDAKKAVPFSPSEEIYRRNGELLEALCINTIDQHQAALATNRKGIIFFKWEDRLPDDNGSEYLWAEADWPHNGWAGSESTPVPTCVSPGVGLGSRKGAHLGLGGATVGAGPLPRPGRDVINGGAFGVPGYAGMGVSSLGWGVQEDFEQFVDPPPTVDSVKTSSFSTHPSRPLFLVGSSNTHIYLWEFGKDRAIATYGVLPAANVPPPYALASISAVRFDHYGHRFVTAALDGTVCTWQLEVGGRSNVRPTESSICFDNHTSDVTYITASGSIIAAAGYSSTGVNVVIWDTLAPSASSRASIMCHEGGARSLSVFDNNIGSGSISPLIVTGGKGGDVGLHDFRYIATGRTKKQKQSDASEPNANTATVNMQNKSGDQNRNGMLWYIPKAHSGSVTKISTIPKTSFFLTGSKDGDVKLWDAKTARLVFHWPKLHDRHTFLQPSSRGFGGVFRAAVTDIQVVSHGFLTCGGDGSVKLVKLRDFDHI